MENKTIEMSPNLIYALIIIGVAIAAVLGFILKVSPYLITLALLMGIVGFTATFVACRKHCLSQMHCAMCGMVFGMIPAFIVGTIHALQTGDFVWPIITGTIAGAALGIPFGNIGGDMGRLEAVMAAPMAGIMGSMTGVMVRIYNVDLFMIAFAAIILFVLGETAYMVHKTSGRKLDMKSIGIGCILGLIFLVPVSLISFPTNVAATDLQGFLQESAPSAAAEKQEIGIRITRYGYEPANIDVKKGAAVKLNLQADPDAGCARAFTIPSLGIQKVVQPGGTETVEFTAPNDENINIPFQCSMGMARGMIDVV
ncbi:MAG TPA: cupredoxin domain-containing protein [Candidatus Nanoarchaeia archaeon]|nr:cupredoxin domain-containing protein [Candidatus Nanoarchaeia archaeon]